jgi:ankyrin repeat protein
MTDQDKVYATFELVEEMVTAGADPLSFFVPGTSVAPIASKACHLDCPNLLAALFDKHGADVNDIYGNSLLAEASKHGSRRCVSLLLSRAVDVDAMISIDEFNSFQFTSLYMAAQNGHVAVCRLLVDAGAALETVCGKIHWSPLHVAASKGHAGVAMLLLQRGADTCATDVAGRTPIFLGARKEHVLVVKALLPHADLTHRDGFGYSLLHIAAVFGGPAVLEAILPRYLEAGLIDILISGEGDHRESTPLLMACQDSKHAEMKLLLDAGASRHVHDGDGFGPLYCSAYHASLACMQLLLGSGPNWHYTPEQLNETSKYKGFTPLHKAAEGTQKAMCKMLIAAGADPNLQSLHAVTPLMNACRTASHSAAKLLLKKGASRHAKDLSGCTPLHWCVRGASLACLELLLGSASNRHYTPQQLHEVNVDGWTPLCLAVGDGDVTMCRLLIDAGADTNVKTFTGDTCFDFAHTNWPDRPELAALFDPGAVHEPLPPPCCANCQYIGAGLRACAKCHAVRYCGMACHKAHRSVHKVTCVCVKEVAAAHEAARRTEG